MIGSLTNLFPGAVSPWLFLFDLVIVAVIFYYLLLFVRGTRAVIILVGAGMVVLLYLGVRQLNLVATKWLLEKFLAYGSIVLIVIFAPEIREYLAELGRRGMAFNFVPISREKGESGRELIRKLVSACEKMSNQRIGALIALEREEDIEHQRVILGEQIDSEVSERLLLTIFNKKSPLHDGGLIIRNRRISHANCFFPLSENPLLERSMGSRHRAAVGLTEVSDAVVVVVSEQTGAISVAVNGRIAQNLSPRQLGEQLEVLLTEESERATELVEPDFSRLGRQV